MTRFAIEFNDAGLMVTDTARILVEEPGYAFVDSGATLTGQAAYANARIKPMHVSNRYWANLSPSNESSDAANNAELAYEQLKQLWSRINDKESEAVFVVPGSYDATQLGLLLGLAQECGIRVSAMVDGALGASARAYPDRELLHIDAGLHSVSLARIDQSDGASIAARHAVNQVGMSTLFDVVAKAIAEAFVFATRFDPLHHAVSEQALYNNLPNWLDTLYAGATVNAEISHDGDVLQVAIEPDRIRGACIGFYRHIVQLISNHRDTERPIVVQLSGRLAGLPGLVNELARIDDAEIVELPKGQAAFSALERIEITASDSAEVRLLKRLPFSDEAPPYQAIKANGIASVLQSDTPTHIVCMGVAYRLDQGRIVVGRERIGTERTIIVGGKDAGVSRSHFELELGRDTLRLRDMSRHGTYVNQQRVAEYADLRIGDVIQIGSPSVELQIVTVETGSGA